MCEVCQTNSIFTVNSAESRYDPTRTTVLRNTFARASNARYDRFVSTVVAAIVQQDVFGLNRPTTYNQNLPPSQAFAFRTDPQKVEAFLAWIQTLIDQQLLTVRSVPGIGTTLDARWTDMYIEDSYKRGVIRARSEMRKAGMTGVPTIDQTGGIAAVMAAPAHIDRVGILFIRTFEELKGINSQMATQISRVLSQGLIDGDDGRTLARKLRRTITGMGEDLGITDSLGRFIPAKRKAEIMTRTEIIRAHHRGMIQEYRNWGLEGVSVQAEFRTAQDNRVCPKCDALHGNVFSLDEAENLIPVHPQCRCIVLPFMSR